MSLRQTSLKQTIHIKLVLNCYTLTCFLCRRHKKDNTRMCSVTVALNKNSFLIGYKQWHCGLLFKKTRVLQILRLQKCPRFRSQTSVFIYLRVCLSVCLFICLFFDKFFLFSSRITIMYIQQRFVLFKAISITRMGTDSFLIFLWTI